MKRPNNSASLKDVKELIAFGKRCSKTLFPNPGREGCPGYASLRVMAYRDPILSLEDLPISHVVHCSPCFREYSRLRQISLFKRGLQITLASMVAIAVCVVAAQFVRTYIRRNGAPLVSEQRQSGPQQSETNPQVSTLRVPITIDLAAFSPTRSDEKEDLTKTIRLPQKLLRVTFQMPVGMEPGEYAVQLKDSAGTLYADTRAIGRISDGTTSLEVDFDLRTTSQRNFTLMIRPPGLGWRTFPLLVQ